MKDIKQILADVKPREFYLTTCSGEYFNEDQKEQAIEYTKNWGNGELLLNEYPVIHVKDAAYSDLLEKLLIEACEALDFNYEYFSTKQHKCIDLLKEQKQTLASIRSQLEKK